MKLGIFPPETSVCCVFLFFVFLFLFYSGNRNKTNEQTHKGEVGKRDGSHAGVTLLGTINNSD